MMMNWNMNFFMLLNMLFLIIIVGLAIYGIMLLIAKIFNKGEIKQQNSYTKEEDSSLQILKERFARGEIEEEEFQYKSTLLKKHSQE